MYKKIIFSLLVLIIIIGFTFLFTSNTKMLDVSQIEKITSPVISYIDKLPQRSHYTYNTKCELMLWHLETFGVAQFTFREIQSDEFKTKYPNEIRTIEEYNEQYNSIVGQTKDASDAWRQFPSKVIDSTFEIMSNEISINPELKPFVHSLFLGKFTNEGVSEIILNDKTTCGIDVQKILDSR